MAIQNGLNGYKEWPEQLQPSHATTRCALHRARVWNAHGFGRIANRYRSKPDVFRSRPQDKSIARRVRSYRKARPHDAVMGEALVPILFDLGLKTGASRLKPFLKKAWARRLVAGATSARSRPVMRHLVGAHRVRDAFRSPLYRDFRRSCETHYAEHRAQVRS